MSLAAHWIANRGPFRYRKRQPVSRCHGMPLTPFSTFCLANWWTMLALRARLNAWASLWGCILVVSHKCWALVRPDYVGGLLVISSLLGCGYLRAKPEAPITNVVSDYEQAIQEHQSGLKLRSENKLDGALEAFTKAIALDPTNDRYFFDRGQTFVAKGFPDLAADDFTAALRLNPTAHDAVLARAETWLALGQPTDAVEDGRLAVRLNPASAESYRALGLAYSRSKHHEYEQAIACLNEAAKLDPQLSAIASSEIAKSYFNWAVALNRQGKLIESESAFAEAKQRDPKFADDYEAFKKSRMDSTVPGPVRHEVAFRGGLNTSPVIHDAKAVELEQQATELLHKKDYVAAIEKFTESLKLDDANFAAWFGRGKAFLEHGFPDTAVDDFNTALNFTSQPANVLFARGQAYAAQNKQFIAVQDFTEAIRLKPTFPEAYFERGRAHLASRYYDRALADLQEAAKRDPKLAQAAKPLISKAYRGRADDKLIAENFAGTIRDLNESLKMEPKLAATYHVRGVAYAKLGKWSAALADYQRAIQLNPDLETHRLKDEIEEAEKNLSAAAPGGATDRNNVRR